MREVDFEPTAIEHLKTPPDRAALVNLLQQG